MSNSSSSRQALLSQWVSPVSLCGEIGIARGPRRRTSDIDHACPRAPPWAETCGCSSRCDDCPFANDVKAVTDFSHQVTHRTRHRRCHYYYSNYDLLSLTVLLPLLLLVLLRTRSLFDWCPQLFAVLSHISDKCRTPRRSARKGASGSKWSIPRVWKVGPDRGGVGPFWLRRKAGSSCSTALLRLPSMSSVSGY